MKDPRKLPYRPAPGLIPQELLEKTFQCPICTASVAVPWLQKLDFPIQPVRSLTSDGHWVPISFPLECTSCEKPFNVNVKVSEYESKWALYGDEAGRFIEKPLEIYSKRALNFFCITLVGLHKNKHDRVMKNIHKLKRSIAPSLEPESWQHHFSDIWSSKPGAGKYNLNNKEEKIKYARSFAKVIREARPELATFNISGCLYCPHEKNERKKHLKRQKEEIFSQAILTTLRQLRAYKKSLYWIFDNVKDATGGERTEGWAEECFLGLQYTRLFTWLSAGAAIEKPEFVRPGSHFLLEIADFISYTVARDFEKSIQGMCSEVPSSLLGNGFYQGTIANGNVLYTWNRGLPLKFFYGIDPKK